MAEFDKDWYHELVERLFSLHPPKDDHVAEMMDGTRAAHKELAHRAVDVAPNSADLTIAIRSQHRACMDTIAAIACNQDLIPGENV